MTPAMIIRAALGWVGISFPLQGFVYFLLAMAFLLVGVGACKYQR